MYAKNAWKKYANNLSEVMDFNEGYKTFLNNAKTERLFVKETIKLVETKGYKPLSSFTTLKKGDKIYVNNRDKNIALFVIGEKPLQEGINILGAHIDSPRMDLKQNPLYESQGFTLLDTHYYGGIKKYQWVTIQLALHGVIYKKDGSCVEIHIGDEEDDPVVGVNDLLIHLAGDQMQKTAAKVIEGEALDLTFGSIPSNDEKASTKDYILGLLKEKYDIEEEDFLSAEIEVVPAAKARDYGLSWSFLHRSLRPP